MYSNIFLSSIIALRKNIAHVNLFKFIKYIVNGKKKNESLEVILVRLFFINFLST